MNREASVVRQSSGDERMASYGGGEDQRCPVGAKLQRLQMSGLFFQFCFPFPSDRITTELPENDISCHSYIIIYWAKFYFSKDSLLVDI